MCAILRTFPPPRITCMYDSFSARVALVTGAASGIGAAVCSQLAGAGATVIAADINAQAAQAVALSVGGKVQAVGLDVSDPDALRVCIDRIMREHGGLHLAVNNAGIAGNSLDTADYPLDEWHRVLAVNLHGVFYSMKYEIPALLASGGGAIVNMASVLGSNGWAGSAAYVAAKHALVGMTKSAAIEYAGRGLRINAVGPGFIETPMLPPMTDDDYARLVGLHPAGRLGSAAEVAELTCFLLSQRASFINGSYHLVDGGYSAA
jgi:NAD(P)-dependent dehydrogenase (short-subunit alcohol dehydrogenase family)